VIKGKMNLEASIYFSNEGHQSYQVTRQRFVKLSDLNEQTIRPYHGEQLHSIQLFGGCAVVAIGGPADKYGSIHSPHESYKFFYPRDLRAGCESEMTSDHTDHFVSVIATQPYVRHPLVYKLVVDLFSKTSMLCDPSSGVHQKDVQRLLPGVRTQKPCVSGEFIDI
ncbi:MAG TPA: hypothetical protein VK158_06275, partial [Acidobacteriota bacterium]|nr:hypothetical protein [Acidobacteriota bacterium]